MKSDYLLPRENIVDEQMTVIRWHVKDRDFVGKEKKFLEVETSKTVLDLVCEEPGFIHCRVNEGDTVSVGSVLATFYSDLSKLEADLEKTNLEGRRESISIKRPSEADVAQNFSEIASSESHESVHFSKAAREYIEINNIDPNFFKGYELVTTQIIKEVLGKIEKGNEFNAGPKSGHIVEEETKTKSDQLKSKKISALKKLEISLLEAGQSGNINSSLTVQFKSEKIRKVINERGTFNGQIFILILFELSRLLEEFPAFTAYYEKERIYYYGRVNIGIAMDMEKGLKVVVIKDANHLSNMELTEELTNKGINYLEDKLSINDITGGTITVTDLSSDGIMQFQPLINKKQSVILGIGGDESLDGFPMTLTLVFDHRVLTGREVSIFINKLKNRLLSYAPDASG
mgnify:CR=1 FL=1|tara:strand:+ start:1517 stop:2722 length:1206 start_codon:yes stop_codon:yes gene_type:complete